MKKIILAFVCSVLLSACTDTVISPYDSTSVNGAPLLAKPIARSAKIAVIVSTGNSMNLYQNQREYNSSNPLPGRLATSLDQHYRQVIFNTLKQQGYQRLYNINLPIRNTLNSDGLESSTAQIGSDFAQGLGLGLVGPGRGTLTPSAKNYLKSHLKQKDTDVILILTKDDKIDKTYNILCQADKQTTSVSFGYKYYVIDAKTLSILVWRPVDIPIEAGGATECLKLVDIFKNSGNANKVQSFNINAQLTEKLSGILHDELVSILTATEH